MRMYVPPSYQPFGRTGVINSSEDSSCVSMLPYQPIHMAMSGVYTGAINEPTSWAVGWKLACVTWLYGCSVRSVHDIAPRSRPQPSRAPQVRSVIFMEYLS